MKLQANIREVGLLWFVAVVVPCAYALRLVRGDHGHWGSTTFQLNDVADFE